MSGRVTRHWGLAIVVCDMLLIVFAEPLKNENLKNWGVMLFENVIWNNWYQVILV